MNPKWFGDSYDIVKRFFAQVIRHHGYEVYIDPMLTGAWNGSEDNLYNFFKMLPLDEYHGGESALFLDPDTGVGKNPSPQHTTIPAIAALLPEHELVFAFDQSFSRTGRASDKMREKLALLAEHGGTGFYFDSHARFLFASQNSERINKLRQAFLDTGLPETRFVR